MEQNSSVEEPTMEETKGTGTLATDKVSTEAKNKEEIHEQSQTDKINAGNINAVPPTKDSEKLKEKKEPAEAYGKKFEGAQLWEQIHKYTKNIVIDEDGDFCWPEQREHTEKIIEQLLVKRILFIRSASEDWLYPAVQRLASVFQANGKPENLLLRITRNNFYADKSAKEKLEFGFWHNQPRLPCPVVVFISADQQDFVQKFLSLSKEVFLNQIFTDLKNTNLFIVCEVEDNVTNTELFYRFQKRTKNEIFALWDIPVVKLYLLKELGKKGEVFFQNLNDNALIQPDSQRNLYEELIKIDIRVETEVTDSLFTKLQDVGRDIENNKQKLNGVMMGDDFISKVVIFCGAFFDGLYYPDFYKLVAAILLDEKEEIIGLKQVTNPYGLSIEAQPRLLSDIWEKNADHILKNCLLETRRDGGNNRVGFVIPRLAKIMADYFENAEYPFFYKIYRNFEKTGLLTNPDLSEKLEPFVIRFFTTAAKMDISTHNAKWLKNVVYGLWKLYENNLPVNESYDELMLYIHREKKIAPIVFYRIPLIIGGLLTNSNEQFKEIVKEFFRLLLSEANAKKMAIIIAAYLYKNYRFTNIFSSDDLVSYFCRTLNEGKWKESFFAYDALMESMSYMELEEQTKKWIEDKEISDGSWTKQFAYLYQVDFILVTAYRYFRQFKGETKYELWETKGEEHFPDSFKDLMKILLSERCFKSLEAIFYSEDGANRFVYLVRLFESVESAKILRVADRFQPPGDEAFTLIADVLETWFYILTHKQEQLKTDSAIENNWAEYSKMIIEYCDAKYHRLIRKYWSDKLKFYSMEIDAMKVEARTSRRKEDQYEEQLRKRRISLRLLSNLTQINRR